MSTPINAARTLWGREPAAIIAAIQAILALAVGFGLRLSAEQTALILAAAAAVLGLVTRSQVTPAAETAAKADPESPTGASAGPAVDLPDGTPVDVERAIPGSLLPDDPEELPHEAP